MLLKTTLRRQSVTHPRWTFSRGRQSMDHETNAFASALSVAFSRSSFREAIANRLEFGLGLLRLEDYRGTDPKPEECKTHARAADAKTVPRNEGLDVDANALCWPMLQYEDATTTIYPCMQGRNGDES
uniref:Uncharacterized protein n=1 Tax=Mycena chlorophos TaxID=658473 RepID=A0ABQ0LJT4_MYCCL|nr:predicted protein [Mycena chlorophos]